MRVVLKRLKFKKLPLFINRGDKKLVYIVKVYKLKRFKEYKI